MGAAPFSYRWLAFAAGVPERENFEFGRVGAVVDEVANPAEKETTNPWSSRTVVLRTDAWLFSEKSDGLAEIGGDGTKCGWAVGEPPRGGLADLIGCTGRDLDP